MSSNTFAMNAVMHVLAAGDIAAHVLQIRDMILMRVTDQHGVDGWAIITTKDRDRYWDSGSSNAAKMTRGRRGAVLVTFLGGALFVQATGLR